MASADGFLSALQAAYRENRHDDLAALLDPLSQDAVTLKHGLNSQPHLRPSSYTSLTKTFFQSNVAFADFVAAYLLLIRDAQLQDNGMVDIPAQSALNAFELLSSCYNLAITLLAGQEAAWFVPTLRKLANALPTLAFRADRAAGDFKDTQAGIAVRLLTRSLSICAAERDAQWPSKRNAVFFLANQSFKVYFHLNNLRLCDTVVKNVRDARDYLDTQYPKADRATFAYYMGRMYLYQRRLRKAVHELRKAFSLCTNRHPANKRLILVYLITASMPLGNFPHPALLKQYNLSQQYSRLISAVKVGNFRAVLRELDTWQEWHLRKGTYLVLKEKLEVICWRNLARRALLVHRRASGISADSSGPPTLPLAVLLPAAKVAFDDHPELDVDDIEAMCASLMDQGYIKAYIWQSRGLLVLQKGQQLGFPPVSTVRMQGDDA